MKIALLIVGLILAALLAQQINVLLTRCPNCGKFGKSKYKGRNFLGKGRSYSGGSTDSVQTKRYNEKFSCQACGHEFSRSRRN